MKLIISATGPDPDDDVDPRFGRAPHFIAFDTAGECYTPYDNSEQVAAAQGAGVQAAQRIVALGGQVLLTGHCGPKAFEVLTAAGVTIHSGCTGTVTEAVRAWQAGELAALTAPDGRAHH